MCNHHEKECPEVRNVVCSAVGYSHRHCSIDGCIIQEMAEDGFVDDVSCNDCGLPIHRDCAKPIYRDVTICPDYCPSKGAPHIHCASFGCVLWDEAAIACAQCGAKVCAGCARGSGRCYDCSARRMNRFVNGSLQAGLVA